MATATKEVKQVKTEDEMREEYLNEIVPFVLRKPLGVDTKDTSRTVTINGYNRQIQYNKQVMIPRFVAQFLESMVDAEDKAQELIEANAMDV